MVEKKVPLEDPLLQSDDITKYWGGAVLLSDQIQYYCDNLIPPLIKCLKVENLKPARYNIRLGDEAHVEGRRQKIDDNNPLVIEPHQVAIIKTYEEINLPMFLIARWNLRVDMAYEGLLWVGGMQVDPGWQGSLTCPIYNLSNRTIILNYQQNILTMDFVRTTPYWNGNKDNYNGREPYRDSYKYTSKLYDGKGSPNIADNDKYRIRSAVGATAESVKNLENQLRIAATVGLTSFGILFAALAVLATSSISSDSGIGQSLLTTVVPISFVSLFSALIAIVLSSFGITRQSHPVRARSPSWIWLTVTFVAIANLLWGLSIWTRLAGTWLEAYNLGWALQLPPIYGVLHVLVSVALSGIVFWELTAKK